MSEEYLGDIAGPADDGRASGVGPVMSAVAAVSVDVGRVRALVEQLTAEHAAAARQLGRLMPLAAKVEQLQMQLEQLAEETEQLSAHVEQMATQELPSRPVDWAHVPSDARQDWMVELAAWVRDVLFTGWPHAMEELPSCWPLHRDLVNDCAVLRTTYDAAYESADARAHHAVDFRRLLEDVLRSAAARTRGCPTQGSDRPHPVPRSARDDIDQVHAAQRLGLLAELRALVEQANHPSTPQSLRTEAAEHAKRLFRQHGITQEEYTAYEQMLRR
ncbi:hypothetical protein [Sinosporangium album]|uniref:hypothetical protein n=1 Tax=Sinosporangium album TaxID=504805 RepID=UPI000B8258DB|nr:hypothetical protein [Sinosporangium album]